MSNSQKYYVHEVYPYYKNFGLFKALPDHSNKKPVDINKVLVDQKNMIAAEMNQNLKSNPTVEKELQEYIQGVMGLSGQTIKKDMTSAQFESIRDAISQISEAKITETVGITEASKNQIRNEVNQQVRKVLSPSQKRQVVSKAQVDKLVSELQSIASNRNLSGPLAKEYKTLVNKITKIYNDILASSSYNQYEKSIKLETFKRDNRIKKTKGAARLVNLINTAYQYVAINNISNKIGEVGELFGLMATYMYANKLDTVPPELIQELINAKNNKGISVHWLGQDSSQKIYQDDGLSIRGEYIDQDTRIGYVVHKNATQDKVDFQVSIPDMGMTTFSMKNYANTNQMTILNGRLLPLLEQYQAFQYHYLNMVADHKKLQNSSFDGETE